MKIRLSLLLAIGLAASSGGQAKVTLGSPFKTHMILQQNTPNHFWGTSTGKTVTVSSTWSDRTATCPVRSDGTWDLYYATPAATFEKQKLTFTDDTGGRMSIYNVLIGEVWIASGQSNMEFPVNGWGSSPSLDKDSLIAAADKYKDKIHFVTIPEKYNRLPQTSTTVNWVNCSSTTVGTFSAVAFTFACLLSDSLNVPIGVVNASYGGSNVEAWCSRDTYLSFGKGLSASTFASMSQRVPTVNYNGLIQPIEGLTAKGFIWYQGCANAWSGNTTYTYYFSRMIQDWRKAWGNLDMPFYFAELAPYSDGDVNRTNYAELREQQHATRLMLPHCRMVGLNDCVLPSETDQIHPGHKWKVGRRMAFAALHDVYGYGSLKVDYPELESIRFKDGKAYLKFSHTEDGFNISKNITGFEIGGSNAALTAATAVVENGEVVVSAPTVKQPNAVHYCFRNFLLGNLKNKAGLPVVPFRSESSNARITTPDAIVKGKRLTSADIAAGDTILLNAASCREALPYYFSGVDMQTSVDNNAAFIVEDADRNATTGHHQIYLKQVSTGNYVAAKNIAYSSNPVFVDEKAMATPFVIASAKDSSETSPSYTPGWDENSVTFTAEYFNPNGVYAPRFLINRWASGKSLIASYRNRNAWNVYRYATAYNAERSALAGAVKYASQNLDHFAAGTDPGFLPKAYLDTYLSSIAEAKSALNSNVTAEQSTAIASNIFRLNAAIDTNLVPIEEGYYTIESACPTFSESKSMCDNGNGTLGWANTQKTGKFLFHFTKSENGRWYIQCTGTKQFITGNITTGTVAAMGTNPVEHVFTKLYNGQWGLRCVNSEFEYQANGTGASVGDVYTMSIKYNSPSAWYLHRVTDEAYINAAEAEGINAIRPGVDERVNVYGIDGRLIRTNITIADATGNLPKGIYIVGKKKIGVR